ncbi:DUF3152 domain-containing protein [Actinoplanes sp. NPDC049599]|uniref:DUF3152 domain-containing protein n=1 Tax=Actinoplanes sp. NPDC049599 TaxID=3363903 RepID=UPI0037B7611B
MTKTNSPPRAATKQPTGFPEGFLPPLGTAADPPPRPTTPPPPGSGADSESPVHTPPNTGSADSETPTTGSGADESITTRTYRNRRRAAVLVFLVLAVIVLVLGQVMRDRKTAGPALPPAAAVTKASVRHTINKVSPVAVGGFAVAGGHGPVLGSAGTLRRFKVAVEERIGRALGGDFADEVERVLGDPRSWTAGRDLRLQRVPASARAEFTVYLASAGTSEKMCAGGGLRTEAFTSCRLPGRVIINSARWAAAVPGYDAPLAVYRAYAINHEVGHQLGHGHEACGGRGEPAPVMMQQTYGLKGCVANAWPYLRGKRFAGNPID